MVKKVIRKSCIYMIRQILFVYSNDLILFVKKYKNYLLLILWWIKLLKFTNNETISINILTLDW